MLSTRFFTIIMLAIMQNTAFVSMQEEKTISPMNKNISPNQQNINEIFQPESAPVQTTSLGGQTQSMLNQNTIPLPWNLYGGYPFLYNPLLTIQQPLSTTSPLDAQSTMPPYGGYPFPYPPQEINLMNCYKQNLNHQVLPSLNNGPSNPYHPNEQPLNPTKSNIKPFSPQNPSNIQTEITNLNQIFSASNNNEINNETTTLPNQKQNEDFSWSSEISTIIKKVIQESTESYKKDMSLIFNQNLFNQEALQQKTKEFSQQFCQRFLLEFKKSYINLDALDDIQNLSKEQKEMLDLIKDYIKNQELNKNGIELENHLPINEKILNNDKAPSISEIIPNKHQASDPNEEKIVLFPENPMQDDNQKSGDNQESDILPSHIRLNPPSKKIKKIKKIKNKNKVIHGVTKKDIVLFYLTDQKKANQFSETCRKYNIRSSALYRIIAMHKKNNENPKLNKLFTSKGTQQYIKNKHQEQLQKLKSDRRFDELFQPHDLSEPVTQKELVIRLARAYFELSKESYQDACYACNITVNGGYLLIKKYEQDPKDTFFNNLLDINTIRKQGKRAAIKKNKENEQPSKKYIKDPQDESLI